MIYWFSQLQQNIKFCLPSIKSSQIVLTSGSKDPRVPWHKTKINEKKSQKQTKGVTLFFFFQKLDGKTLLLRIACTWTKGHRESRWYTDLALSPLVSIRLFQDYKELHHLLLLLKHSWQYSWVESREMSMNLWTDRDLVVEKLQATLFGP